MSSRIRFILFFMMQFYFFDAVASPILTHRYSFEGDFSDSVGSSDGSLIGGATIVGGALELPGTGGTRENYGELPSTIGGEIAGYNGLSIEVWFTQDTIQEWAKVFFFGRDAGGSADNSIELTAYKGDGTGRSKVEISNSTGISSWGSNSRSEPSPQFATGTKYYVAATFDDLNNSLSFYSDGSLSGSDSMAQDLSSAILTSLFLGAAVGWNDPDFDGSIEEFRIWNGVLTSDQIASHAGSGPDLIPTTIPTPNIVFLLLIGMLAITKSYVAQKFDE